MGDTYSGAQLLGSICHWVRFFLSAVIETANKGKETFMDILALRQEMDSLILRYGRRAGNAQTLINRLYSRPTIITNDTAELLGISHQASSALLNKMVNDGILPEVTGYQRNRVFFFSRYLELFH